MVVLGLVLVVLGVALALAGIFGTGYEYDDDNEFASTGFLNLDVDPTAIFVIGIVAGALVVVGLWAMKVGAQINWKQRKEQKRLRNLSDRLERAEAGRREDGPPPPPSV